MKTIKFNGKNLDVSASEERVLRILKSNNFSAKKAEFAEGSGNYIKSILPKDRERRKELGIAEIFSGRSAREVRFFKENPRCQSGIFGNPRRIKAILKALNAEVERECKQELEWMRYQNLTIPSDAEMEREIVNLRCDY